MAPEPRDVRYRLIRPLKKALAGSLSAGEIEHLIEVIRGVGLRLNLPGPAEVVYRNGRAELRSAGVTGAR